MSTQSIHNEKANHEGEGEVTPQQSEGSLKVLQLGLETVPLILGLQFDAGVLSISRLWKVSQMERLGEEHAKGHTDLLDGESQEEREPDSLVHEG